ncbi:MAG: hypothetical protein O7F12_07845 [Nitrospirae bacterium]|nr:hypothetical protein [Nitrospirota bacterium]
MTYLLLAIAGMWLADGLALLAIPERMVALLKTSLDLSPSVLKWSGLAALLGIFLALGSEGLPYHPLWMFIGVGMVGKGLFLIWASEALRKPVLTWCLNREPVDYRFWGLGLCTLSLLLLDALGVLQGE